MWYLRCTTSTEILHRAPMQKVKTCYTYVRTQYFPDTPRTRDSSTFDSISAAHPCSQFVLIVLAVLAVRIGIRCLWFNTICKAVIPFWCIYMPQLGFLSNFGCVLSRFLCWTKMPIILIASLDSISCVGETKKSCFGCWYVIATRQWLYFVLELGFPLFSKGCVGFCMEFDR